MPNATNDIMLDLFLALLLELDQSTVSIKLRTICYADKKKS